MENKRPLLSICIPTYNRVQYLKEALENITSDKAFDQRVEIVISDNASTDGTQIAVEKFKQKHTNIKYYKNEINIKDKNFYLALSRGQGKYVRLFNDTLKFKDGALEYFLNVIENSSENTPLFFYQNISFLNNVNKNISINDINDFLNQTSYWVTWIANMGNWKYEIDNIQVPYEFSSLQLVQVDWTYQICNKNNSISIHFGDFVTSTSIKNKGGYNLYKVFITNYLYILRKYAFKSNIIQKEKYRLLRYFITPWYITLKFNKEFTFIQDNKWNILFKEYGLDIYFYLFIIYWWIKISIKRFIMLFYKKS